MKVEAELVKRSGSRLEVPKPERFELYTRERRKAIIQALTPDEETDDPEKYRPASFVSDAANHAGISPGVLKAWLAHGEQFPNGPLGRFNREVRKLVASRNDMMQKAIWDLSHKKKSWEGIARLGEQSDSDSWTRPSEKNGRTNININIVDKLAIVNAEDGNPISTGD